MKSSRSILVFVSLLALASTPAMAATLTETLDAIRTVESGGRDIVGDGGAAIGPYQIHKGYWKDSGVPGKWEDCHNEAYARQVVIAYMKRYCPTAIKNPDDVNAEVMSRKHNGGGPKGEKNPATVKYWLKVKKVLES